MHWYRVRADLALCFVQGEFMKDLEKFLKAAGFVGNKVEIDERSELFVLSDVSREDFDCVVGLLSKDAKKTAENGIGENAFYFALSGDDFIGVRFYPKKCEIRVTCETGNDYFSVFPEHKKGAQTITPLLTQNRVACMSADCGMSYVLRTADGRFALVDGGMDDYEESERLYDLLCKQNAGSGKPVIAAWFITHMHDDHTTVFCRLWKEHKDDIVLESLVYNIVPDKFNVKYPHEVFDALLPEIKAHGTALVTARAGMKFSFAGLDIDMLYTPDDYLPNVFSNFNDSSLIFRADFAGRRILFLGDAMPLSSDIVANRYEKNDLASEFLQVGHHGYGGGSDALDTASDPETLLWPCPAFWYPSVRLWKSNDVLRNSPHIKHILMAGFGSVTLDMTKPVEDAPKKAYNSGDTVYEEDFESKKRLIDLGYESVTGGATGLVPAKYGFETDAFGRYLAVSSDANSLIGIASQDTLAGLAGYEATFMLRAPKDAKIGIMAACKMPNEWQGEHTRWFTLAASEKPRALTVKTDYKAHTLAITLDGKTHAFETADMCGGLYLALEKTQTMLYHVKITAL